MRGNQGKIYEHSNESYAHFNYNNPELFEACSYSLKSFALCFTLLNKTDKCRSSGAFAYFFAVIIGIGLTNLLQDKRRIHLAC